MSISQWSTTAADNDDAADNINWAEGQLPSTVNNSARQMMADVAAWYAQLVGAGMLFAQAAAPTGWTKDATTYDHALRLTSGDGGGTDGTEDFSTVFALTATDTHALTQAEMPSHTHTITVSNPSHTHTATQSSHAHNYTETSLGGASSSVGSGGDRLKFFTGTTTSVAPAITVGAATTAVTASAASVGSGTAHSHNISLKVKYYDLIRCTKDS